MRRSNYLLFAALVLAALIVPQPASAAVITFDDLVTGQTSYGFDGDGDSINDVIFSTTDPAGFNTVGPGASQNYIDEPGLEGTTLLNPDLRVDFVFGASGSLSFGFALNSSSAQPQYAATFSVFDASDNLLATSTVPGEIFAAPIQSMFPEGEVTVVFNGIAAYGLFDFTSEFSRYIIDNFEGNFGSAAQIPEPGSVALVLLGGLALAAFRRFR